VTSDETASTPRRKRRRAKQSQDLANSESLCAIVDSLDMLYQARLNHQRTITTIIGKIDIVNRRLIAESQELQDPRYADYLRRTIKIGASRSS
jgi:hypothetical protein